MLHISVALRTPSRKLPGLHSWWDCFSVPRDLKITDKLAVRSGGCEHASILQNLSTVGISFITNFKFGRASKQCTFTKLWRVFKEFVKCHCWEGGKTISGLVSGVWQSNCWERVTKPLVEQRGFAPAPLSAAALQRLHTQQSPAPRATCRPGQHSCKCCSCTPALERAW